MATRLYASIGAFFLALTAIYLHQPLSNLLHKTTGTRIQLPFINSHPTVIDPVREITYIGTRSPAAAVDHFQNIFYAENPTGPRRFAPPIPVKPRKGSVIDATRPGAWCPQGTGDILPFTSRVTNISEDCLSLRIARPSGTKRGEEFPVVVWIHGGSASDVLYEPDGLVMQAVAEGKPLVYVGINYRLGLFGFATSRTLIERKETNAGLRDQRAALEWVRDNIESFGGDPKRVTVIGQSVGASDLGLQLTAFGGAQDVPFQQGMMMSGGPGLNFNSHPDLVASNTAAIAQQVGCVKDGDDQSPQTLQCLREVPFEVLTNLSVTASRTARPPFGEGFFYPTIDKDFIHDRPSQLIRAGKFAKGVSLIASWVTNDGAWYALPTTSTDEEVLASFGLWLSNLSADTKAKLLDLYPLDDFEHMVRTECDGPISAQYYRAAQINRDIWFTCPVLDFTWQYVRNGGVAASQVRLYQHNETRYTPVFGGMGVPMWRVAHLSDIPYLFNNRRLGGGADNAGPHLELCAGFSRTVINFVHGGMSETGDGGVEVWPPAFSDGSMQESGSSDGPDRISIRLFGGPHGSVSVTLNRDADASAMTDAEKAVYWEKLFSRCEFINSEQMRAEAGV